MTKWKDSIVKAPTVIEGLLKDLQEFAEKSVDLMKNIDEDIKAANIGFTDMPKTLSAAKKSAARLGKGLKKVQNLGPLIKEAVASMIELCK